MKLFLYTLIAFLFGTFTLIAQQPCNEELAEPTPLCSDAPIICNLYSFCSIMPVLATPQGASICNLGISLDNPHWISFIATSNRVSVTIQPSNCFPVQGGLGLQGAIVSACPPPPGGGPIQTIGFCQAQCSQSAFTIGTDGNFQIGQQYWIMLDGCSGSICDYEIIATQGTTVPLEDPTEITGTTMICPEGTATFTVDDPSFATTFHWMVDGVVVTSSGPELKYTIPAEKPEGIYEICLLDAENACFGLIADNGYQSGSICYEYEVLPKLEFSIEGRPIICEVDSAYLTVDTTFTSIMWTGPEEFSSNQPLINTLEEGIYYITVIDSIGCPASDSIEVVKRPLPPITFTGSTTFCNGGQVRIDIIEQEYLSYQWSDLQTGNNAIFDQEGAYSLRVIDSFLCNNVLDIYIQESDSLTPSVIGITNFCPGDYVEFYAGPSYESYKWNGVNGESSHRMYHSGELVLHVKDQMGCEGSTTLYVHQNDYPILEQVQILDDTGESDGAIMVRFDRFKGGNYTYEWSNGANTPKITNLEAGKYTVTVTHPNGCQAVYTFEVQLNENFNIRNELDKLIFNSEPAWTNLNIYPNPFSDMLIISRSTVIDEATISLLDLNGKLCYKQEIGLQENISLNIENIPPGPYILLYTSAEENFRRLVIKE